MLASRRPVAALVVLLALLGMVVAAAPHGAAAQEPPVAVGDPWAHLERIVELSRPPDYRRLGSAGMAAAADESAAVLQRAGYSVLRHDVPSTVYSVDYSAGRAPALVRVADGAAFRTESAFSLEATTPREGIECTVRTADQVAPGDCGFVPFLEVSPEWTNVLADPGGAVAAIRARGGVGAVLQGDVDHGALIAVKIAQAIPTVVSLVREGDVLGQRVRLRVLGATEPTTLRNVVAVRPPADPAAGYVLLQGHLDGWFAGAADNGGGAAAVLAAAERLAGPSTRRGLIVALYDGEEWGLRGSKALAADLARPAGLVIGPCGPTVRLHDVAAVVNLDAPSAIASDLLGPVRGATGLLLPLFSYRVLVSSPEPTVAALLVTTMTAAGALGLPITAEAAELLNSGVSRTDAKWFHEAGVPIAWPVVGYPEYHTEADGLAAVDPVDLANVTAGTVALVRALDTASVGRVGGSLAAPGSVESPDPICGGPTAPSASTTAVAAVTPSSGRRLPATGSSSTLALGLAGLAAASALLALRRRTAS